MQVRERTATRCHGGERAEGPDGRQQRRGSIVSVRFRLRNRPRCVLNGYVYLEAFCPLTVLECFKWGTCND